VSGSLTTALLASIVGTMMIMSPSVMKSSSSTSSGSSGDGGDGIE